MCPFSSAGDRPDSGPSKYLQSRAVRIRLRDQRSLEGRLHVADGQSLVEFLSLRRSFLNVTQVRWLDGRGGDEPLPHVGLRISHVLWVVPLDPSLPLSSAVSPTDVSRGVELGLWGELLLRVRLHIADEQRMSDYFDSPPTFVPLRSVVVSPSGEALERMAVHRDAILTIREP